MVDVCVDMKCQ